MCDNKAIDVILYNVNHIVLDKKTCAGFSKIYNNLYGMLLVFMVAKCKCTLIKHSLFKEITNGLHNGLHKC